MIKLFNAKAEMKNRNENIKWFNCQLSVGDALFNFKWTHCVERKEQADSSAKQQLKEFWETYAKYKIHFKPETITRDKAGYVIKMEIPIRPKDDSKHNNT